MFQAKSYVHHLIQHRHCHRRRHHNQDYRIQLWLNNLRLLDKICSNEISSAVQQIFHGIHQRPIKLAAYFLFNSRDANTSALGSKVVFTVVVAVVVVLIVVVLNSSKVSKYVKLLPQQQQQKNTKKRKSFYLLVFGCVYCRCSLDGICLHILWLWNSAQENNSLAPQLNGQIINYPNKEV